MKETRKDCFLPSPPLLSCAWPFFGSQSSSESDAAAAFLEDDDAWMEGLSFLDNKYVGAKAAVDV
jgi:hypothetical protein